MRILVVDVGGTHVKLMVNGTEPRKFSSGDGFTPQQLIAGVRQHTAGWVFDVTTIGIPSPVLRGEVKEEPWNLGRGWVGFDYEGEMGVPTRIINDAAMQALGSYEGGRMLFLGLGSGLGTALVDDGRVVPLELAHLPYRDQTFEDYTGQRGLLALGEDEWKRVVLDAAELLRAASAAEYVLLGGGNVRLFEELPPRIRRGHNDRAFEGGFRVWADERPVPSHWKPLSAHAATWAQRKLSFMFDQELNRASRFTLRLGDLVVDYSKNLVDAETMRLLFGLARATGVETLRDRMFAGEPINSTEQRAGPPHRASQPSRPPDAGRQGRDVMPDVPRRARAHPHVQRRGSRRAVDRLHRGRITDVVNIGIGGSDLGPAMATAALEPFTAGAPRLHFVSNVDGAASARRSRSSTHNQRSSSSRRRRSPPRRR